MGVITLVKFNMGSDMNTVKLKKNTVRKHKIKFKEDLKNVTSY